MTKRDRMKKASIKNPLLWPNYKGLSNQCTYAIRKAIQDHYHGLIEETEDDPKKMWKTIKRVLNKDLASKSISSLNVNGKVMTGECELAEALNQHRVSGPKLTEKIKTTPNDNPLIHIKPNDSATLILKPVTNSQVLKSLKQLKKGKACGPDKIPTTLVKDAANFISYPLTLIYNSSIKNVIFPDVWKIIARVAAIFKSGKRCDSNNYRPISVLSTFSRVLEKIVHDQLHEFLKANVF